MDFSVGDYVRYSDKYWDSVKHRYTSKDHNETGRIFHIFPNGWIEVEWSNGFHTWPDRGNLVKAG